MIRRQKIGTGTLMLAMPLMGLCGWLFLAQQQVPAEEAEALAKPDVLYVEYARACQRLAEADLAEAVGRNSRTAGAVNALDLQRLQLQVQYAEQLVSAAEHGSDATESIVAQIELQSKLAQLDLQSAQQLHQRQPELMNAAQLAQLQAYAEVCRLRLQLADEPHNNWQLLDQHLHWETHRLSEEVQLLRRQVDQLQSVVLQ